MGPLTISSVSSDMPVVGATDQQMLKDLSDEASALVTAKDGLQGNATAALNALEVLTFTATHTAQMLAPAPITLESLDASSTVSTEKRIERVLEKLQAAHQADTDQQTCCGILGKVFGFILFSKNLKEPLFSNNLALSDL